MPVRPELFRRVMGSFATGVTIVTTAADGELAGMTVNSLTSVSLEPPLVLFCADHRTRTCRAVEASGVFAVNILPQELRPISDVFASQGRSEAERFGCIGHRASASGAPILEGNMGWLECRVRQAVAAGDHTIFIGEVLSAGAGEGDPLLYFRGRYAKLAFPDAAAEQK